jgi:hypothetical protein
MADRNKQPRGGGRRNPNQSIIQQNPRRNNEADPNKPVRQNRNGAGNPNRGGIQQNPRRNNEADPNQPVRQNRNGARNPNRADIVQDENIDLALGEIFFSQNSISAEFSNQQGNVYKLINELKSLPFDARIARIKDNIPHLQVVWLKSKAFPEPNTNGRNLGRNQLRTNEFQHWLDTATQPHQAPTVIQGQNLESAHRYVSLDNRRLYAFKAVLHPWRMIPVRRVNTEDMKIQRKLQNNLTSYDLGETLFVRENNRPEK